MDAAVDTPCALDALCDIVDVDAFSVYDCTFIVRYSTGCYFFKGVVAPLISELS